MSSSQKASAERRCCVIYDVSSSIERTLNFWQIEAYHEHFTLTLLGGLWTWRIFVFLVFEFTCVDGQYCSWVFLIHILFQALAVLEFGIECAALTMWVTLARLEYIFLAFKHSIIFRLCKYFCHKKVVTCKTFVTPTCWRNCKQPGLLKNLLHFSTKPIFEMIPVSNNVYRLPSTITHEDCSRVRSHEISGDKLPHGLVITTREQPRGFCSNWIFTQTYTETSGRILCVVNLEMKKDGKAWQDSTLFRKVSRAKNYQYERICTWWI